MTTDTTALRERIARALDKNFNPDRYPIMAAMFKDYAAAILPIVEAEVRAAKAEAWDEGHSWGWSDAQDAHDVRQAMDRADWPLNTPNPYRKDTP